MHEADRHLTPGLTRLEFITVMEKQVCSSQRRKCIFVLKETWRPELSEENLIDSMALFIRFLEEGGRGMCTQVPFGDVGDLGKNTQI